MILVEIGRMGHILDQTPDAFDYLGPMRELEDALSARYYPSIEGGGE